MSAAVLEEHLVICVDCARWLDATTTLTRQLRLGAAVAPDLSAAITTDIVLPTRKVMRRRLLLRVVLLLVALVQLGIAIPALAGDSIGMVMSTHAAHEAAAWNLAIGVAFLAAVSRPRRAAGLIPLLATFILVLAVLSVHDVVAGVVSVDRLATHLAAVVGLLLLFAIDRAERALPPGRFAAASRSDRSGGTGTDHGSLRGVA
ncbi:MAG: hypothetical protein ABI232_07025 [Jatrophihabitantaceae bacterium]